MAQAWLFGHATYKKLQIMQPDLQDMYFNCILSSPQVFKSGNMIKGFSCRVICDSPFGWAFPKVSTYTYTSSQNNLALLFMNLSNDNYYLFPTVQITMNSFGGSFSITNTSDGSRIFGFTALSPNEIITVNNDLGIVTSSTGFKRLANFNKNWLRFKKGANSLLINGQAASLRLTYSFAKKIGG